MLRFPSPFAKGMHLLGFVVFLCAGAAPASTVLEMSFAQVVAHSELVFEGRVLSRQARRLSNGSIHTFVDFQVDEVVKGDYSGTTLQLSFLGGQVDGKGMHVTDLQIPLLGETGLYFVETLSQTQVNPLVGWAQGHYLIETLDDGRRIVMTLGNETVVSISEPAEQAPVTSAMNTFSKGKAKGVQITPRSLLSPLNQAMSAEQFKAIVRDVAAQTQ